MQEGSTAQGFAVGQRLAPLGGIENQLDPAIFDGIHHVRAAFRGFQDAVGLEPVLREKALGSGGGDHLEAEAGQGADSLEHAFLVLVPDRDEYRALAGEAGAAAELALDEGDLERTVEAQHLAGRFHLGAEDGVDLLAEAGEREYRLLDAGVGRRPGLEAPGHELEAGEVLARHDAGRDLGHRQADDLRHERHGTRGARIDLQHIDVAVLDGVLHVHQAADLQRQRELAGLVVERGDGCGLEIMRGQRAGGIAGMNAGLLDMLHDAGDECVLAVREAIDVDLDGVRQVAVE